MRLAERLPDRVVSGGKSYHADFDFRRVFAMMDIMADPAILPAARVRLAVAEVVTRPPKKTEGCAALYAEINRVLFGSAPAKVSGEKLTDLDHDADLIRAAFLQAYGINLWRDSLHWHEFSSLLSALPQGSRYAEILGIRARPIPDATKYNTAEREWLMKAKAACALPMTDEERQSIYAQGVRAMAEGMIDYARAQKAGSGSEVKKDG